MMLCMESPQAGDIPMHVQNEIADARLAGQGSFSWYGMKIYDAYLWSDRNAYRPDAPMDNKFILELVYARELQGEHIAESSISEIRTLGFGTPDQHEVWLKMMKAVFPDVRQGTRLSGVYLPYQGARFYLDGRLLNEIADPEFAHAFFAIWLDERTSAGRLRIQLLGPKT
jgi:hypothetical protein